MNVRERLQALLDGKAIVEKASGRSTLPHRLRDDELEYAILSHGWYRTATFKRIFDPKVEFAIYEEPKPEPTAREKLIDELQIFTDPINRKVFLAIADYIDERIKELGK